jgi:hypothetical protein
MGGCSWIADLEARTVDGSEVISGQRAVFLRDRLSLTSPAGSECEAILFQVGDSDERAGAAYLGRVRCDDGETGAVILTQTEEMTSGGDIIGVIGPKRIEGRWGNRDEDFGFDR